jgi:hypothetical protein
MIMTAELTVQEQPPLSRCNSCAISEYGMTAERRADRLLSQLSLYVMLEGNNIEQSTDRLMMHADSTKGNRSSGHYINAFT